MLTYMAVENVGKDVLIIKDGKVIGKGVSQLMYGDEWIGIRFTEGEIMDMTKDLSTVKSMGYKYSYFRYYPYSGVFLGAPSEMGREDEHAILDATLVVDELKLKYGMVPDHFKATPGYCA